MEPSWFIFTLYQWLIINQNIALNIYVESIVIERSSFDRKRGSFISRGFGNYKTVQNGTKFGPGNQSSVCCRSSRRFYFFHRERFRQFLIDRAVNRIDPVLTSVRVSKSVGKLTLVIVGLSRRPNLNERLT